MSDTDIAIIGMAGRFPGAENIDQFWHNLTHGIESLDQFSDYNPQSDISQNPHIPFIKVNNLIKDFDAFDAEFFGISEHEAKLIDPQHRLFLECAWTALEHAGYHLEKLPSLTGLYAGVYANYYLLRNIYPNGIAQDPASELLVTLGNEKDHLTTYTAYKLNLRGPVMTVQATCSSSLAAVHLACESLLTYSADMMLAGGVTISVPQIGGYYYQPGGLLSHDGHIRSFAANATGTVYSNGVGVVVLKRLEDAIKDRNTVFAIIKGSALNNDGALKIGYVAPSMDGQVAVISRALRNADIDPSTISYIEGHGTGTPLGDGIEIDALHQAYSKMQPGACALGSVKSNIGHLGPASGLSALIKVALSLHHKQLPPTLNCDESNEKLDVKSPFYLLKEAKTWGNEKKRAAISSFGLGGTNVHMIVEEASKEKKQPVREEFYVFCLSAKNISSLQKMIIGMKDYLSTHPEIEPHNLCYTLQMGRQAFTHRIAIVFENVKDLCEQLSKFFNISIHPTNESSLFLHLTTSREEELIKFIKSTPQLLDHFNHLTQKLKFLGFPLKVNWQEQNITIEYQSSLIQSAKLFRYFLLNTILLPWLNIESPIQGIIGEGFDLLIALSISKQIEIGDLLPFILEIELGSASTSSLINFFGGRISTIPVYYLKNNKLVVWHENDSTYNLEPVSEITDLHLSVMSKENRRIFTIDGELKGCSCSFQENNFNESDKIEKMHCKLIATLWQFGIPINWECLYKHTQPMYIPLPTYAFQKKKYWIDEKLSSSITIQNEPEKNEELDISQSMILLWQTYLGTDDIDIESNFFEKGGTSLLATSLITAAQKQFGVEIELKHLFEDPTVRGLTNFVLDKLLLQLSENELETLIGINHG